MLGREFSPALLGGSFFFLATYFQNIFSAHSSLQYCTTKEQLRIVKQTTIGDVSDNTQLQLAEPTHT